MRVTPYVALQEAVVKVFTDKVPKVVVAAIDVVTSALRYLIQHFCDMLDVVQSMTSELALLPMQSVWRQSCESTAAPQSPA